MMSYNEERKNLTNDEIEILISKGGSVEEIVEGSLSFCIYMANKYKDHYIYEAEDFIQLALLGLMKAIKAYDPTKGAKFFTYTGRIILNEINYYIRRNRDHYKVKSFDTVCVIDEKSDGDITLEDMLEDKNDYYQETIDSMAIEEIRDILDNKIDITDRNRDIMKQYLFSGKRQAEIAHNINMSQSIVSRIIKKETIKIQKIYNRG